MKVLYVSDLDGTLLTGKVRTTEYTNKVINDLTGQGMLFSYATARSYVTAAAITEGLCARIPIITYNGAMILENGTYRVLMKNGFSGEEKQEILTGLLEAAVWPIVYAHQGERETFSYVLERCSPAQAAFLALRRGDIRETPVKTAEELGRGDVFYFTCIGERETLEPLYLRFKDQYHCIFQKDIYSGHQWLEIMAKTVSKAHAVLQLKARLGADYVVAFGDGKNDVEMFEIADECYAVENAVPELKAIATGVIGDNDSDSVAKWLQQRFMCGEREGT